MRARGFFRGFLTVFCWSAPPRRPRIKWIRKTDAEAIGSDWKAVGNDVAEAAKKAKG
jgi:hypothetical protein